MQREIRFARELAKKFAELPISPKERLSYAILAVSIISQDLAQQSATEVTSRALGKAVRRNGVTVFLRIYNRTNFIIDYSD